MEEMGIFERFFQKWREPAAPSGEGGPEAEDPSWNDRSLMESIAEFDEDPDVRKAAEELLASRAVQMK